MSLIDDYKLAGALFGGKTIQPTGTGYTSADTYTLTGIAQSDSSGGTVSVLLDNYDPDDPQPTTCSTAVAVESGDKVLISVTGFSFSVTSVIGGGDRMQAEINAVVASADGKNKITYSTQPPDYYEGVQVGDTWFELDAYSGVVVAQYQWDSDMWQSKTLDDAVIASITAGKITAGTIEAAIEMTSATVTGGLVRTSATGNRIEIYDDDDAGYIRFHDASGAPRATLGTRVADNVFNIGAGSNDSYAANIDVASTYNASTELLEGTITLDAGENTGEPGRDSGTIAIDKGSVSLRSMVDGTNYTLASITLSHALGVPKISFVGVLNFDDVPAGANGAYSSNQAYTTTASNIVTAGVCDVNDAAATVLDGICNIGFDGNKTDATNVTTSTVLWTVAAAYRPRETVQLPCFLKSGSNMAFRRAIVHPDGTVTLNVAMGTAAFDCTVCGSYSIMTS